VPNLIHYENWDGVTAPAIPSGWTAASQLVTSSSPTGGITPLSSPNVLQFQSLNTPTHYAATYGTADNATGNVLVEASFAAAAVAVLGQTFGVFARGSAYPLLPGSSSYYWATLSPSAMACSLFAVVGGTQTPIGAVALGASLSAGAWYQLQLSCQGSTIAVTVVRASDGYYLNSSGTFQLAPAVAIAQTDHSIFGSGYAGLTIQSHGAVSADNAYSDEWYFYGSSTSSQPGPIRAWPIVQRARGKGQVNQPRAVRFGTPVIPINPLSHGISSRDPSRRRAAIAPGRAWYPQPPPITPPAQIPFAWWPTIKWLDPSAVRRRLAPGRASTPRAFPPPVPPPVVAFAWWKTIRWVDPSALRRRLAPGRSWCPGAAIVPGACVSSGFTQQYITNVNPPVQYGTELFLSWTSNAPQGLVFQVYENDALVWYGVSTYCTLPLPTALVRFDIGTVGSSQQTVSFGSQLPPAPLLQAELSWLGGTFEDPDIAGFHVYGEEAPGSGINYTSILATVPAYTAGIVTDGYGYGGYGQGGYGLASGFYTWISDPLTSGVWHFAVVPFDTAGNEGTGATTAVTIIAPPGEPAPFADRSRLHYTYNAALCEITLSWNPSPG